ncbi:tetratricopeptide repeat protein [Promicromonospora sp. MEB111]|uniref:tetratricopeptide repeat protein n=1 Tax=Promicromonospora sp. MEB111 TaxID=3040301 RepID=UPI0025517139|nr:tetratricopeptide repeat protein [Promicromonospora sp. MEB111]
MDRRTLLASPAPIPSNPAFDPSTYIDFANLTIAVAMAAITVITFALAIVAVLGVRTLNEVRRDRDSLRTELAEASRRRAELDERLHAFEQESERIVLAAHLFNEGQSAYVEADYDRAISYYQQALEIQPGNGRIRVRLARSYINKGINRVAEAVLEAADPNDIDSAGTWRALATAYRYEAPDRAMDNILKAIRVDGSSYESWDYLGLLLRDQKRWAEALEAHRRALSLAPMEPTSSFFAALVALKDGDAGGSRTLLADAAKGVQLKRQSGRIKRAWADVIEWAYEYSRGTASSRAKALRIAKQMARYSVARNRQAVLGHMEFYLAARGEFPADNLCIQAFSHPAEARETTA